MNNRFFYGTSRFFEVPALLRLGERAEPLEPLVASINADPVAVTVSKESGIGLMVKETLLRLALQQSSKQLESFYGPAWRN